MIGLDANVLVRYFMRDDEQQWARAHALILALSVTEPGFIPMVTLAELVWVIRGRYRLTKAEVIRLLDQMMSTPQFVLEEQGVVREALRCFAGSAAEFADCLIERSAASTGCAYTVTFDAQAAQSAGMRMVP